MIAPPRHDFVGDVSQLADPEAACRFTQVALVKYLLTKNLVPCRFARAVYIS